MKHLSFSGDRIDHAIHFILPSSQHISLCIVEKVLACENMIQWCSSEQKVKLQWFPITWQYTAWPYDPMTPFRTKGQTAMISYHMTVYTVQTSLECHIMFASVNYGLHSTMLFPNAAEVFIFKINAVMKMINNVRHRNWEEVWRTIMLTDYKTGNRTLGASNHWPYRKAYSLSSIFASSYPFPCLGMVLSA